MEMLLNFASGQDLLVSLFVPTLMQCAEVLGGEELEILIFKVPPSKHVTTHHYSVKEEQTNSSAIFNPEDLIDCTFVIDQHKIGHCQFNANDSLVR
jgi:hypothetical protein